MATLTTSWQSIASSTWNVSGYNTSVTFYLDAKYSEQSVANNTTTIQTRLRSVLNSGSVSGSGYNFTCSYASTVSGSGVWYFATETITSGGGTITHNADGTKSLTLSATASNTYWSMSKSLSATVSLPTIARKADITSASSFYTNTNPTVYYNNPAGTSVSELKICMINTSDTVTFAGYRDVTKSSGSGSYTFYLSTAERNTIRDYCNSSNQVTVRYVLRTLIGGTYFYSSYDVTATAVYSKAEISTAPDFTDEASPTITYTNPEGSYIDSLQACIAKTNGSTLNINYRDINKTGTLSYTFNLTEAERNSLRQACTGNSMNLNFYIKTYVNGNTYYSSVTRTMYIVNGNPTFSNITSVADTNSTTLALTGDSSKYIKGYSNALVTISSSDKATAKKQASMSSYIVNGISRTYAENFTYTVNGISTNAVTVQASDSRGNSTTVTKSINMINYAPVSNSNNNITVARQNNVGTITTAQFSGTWWNDNFRSSSVNSLSVGQNLSSKQLIMDFDDLTYQAVDNLGLSGSQVIATSSGGYTIELSIVKTRAAGPTGNHALVEIYHQENGASVWVTTLWLGYEDGTLDTNLTSYNLPADFGSLTQVNSSNLVYSMIEYQDTAVSNSLSVSYRYKTTDTSVWTTGTAPTLTISGNTFSFSGAIIGDQADNGFDVNEAYNIEITVSDSLSSATFSVILNAGKPAIAVNKNKVSIGSAYSTSLGGKLQVDGYLVCCYEVVQNI